MIRRILFYPSEETCYTQRTGCARDNSWIWDWCQIWWRLSVVGWSCKQINNAMGKTERLFRLTRIIRFFGDISRFDTGDLMLNSGYQRRVSCIPCFPNYPLSVLTRYGSIWTQTIRRTTEFFSGFLKAILLARHGVWEVARATQNQKLTSETLNKEIWYGGYMGKTPR